MLINIAPGRYFGILVLKCGVSTWLVPAHSPATTTTHVSQANIGEPSNYVSTGAGGVARSVHPGSTPIFIYQ